MSETFTVLDVIFRPEDERTYSYRAGDEKYVEGEIVAVPAGKDDHEAIVCVKAIRECTAEDLAFPVEKLKRVIRHSSKEEYEEYLKSRSEKPKYEKRVIPEREFCVYSDGNVNLDGYILNGCLHLESMVYGDEYDSEKYYDFSKEDTEKLFSIMPFNEFIKKLREGHLLWMEGFLKENGIKPSTFCY